MKRRHQFCALTAALTFLMCMPLSVHAEEMQIIQTDDLDYHNEDELNADASDADDPNADISDADNQDSDTSDDEKSDVDEPQTEEPDMEIPPVRSRPSDRIFLDEEGRAYCLDGTERITGKFSLEPDFMLGDVNGDQQIGTADASAILMSIAESGAQGTAPEKYLSDNFAFYINEEEALMFSDINDDGMIDTSDASNILLYCAMDGAGETRGTLGYAEYIADENGFLQKGFIQSNGMTYFADDSYQLCQGWLNVEGKRYYLDTNGVLQRECWIRMGSLSYYFQEDGTLLCNAWIEDEGHTYYLGENGAAVKGLTEIDGSTFYFTDSGMLTEGWVDLSEYSYYFGENGIMQTGWLTLDDETYYLGTDGKRQYGLQMIDDETYYFQPDTGCMSVSVWIEQPDGWRYFNEDGISASGLLELEEETYYLDESGIRQYGWVEIDSESYYFDDESGIMLTDQAIGDMYVGSDGKAVTLLYHNNQLLAQKALKDYGTSVDNIFSFVRATTRYKKTESTKTLEQIEKLGWLYFVDRSMKEYYGVCYYLAAKMDFVLTEAGYECRIVHATHSSGDHYWNQVKINGTWVNYDCTNNLKNRTWDQMVAFGSYKFLGYVRPEYH